MRKVTGFVLVFLYSCFSIIYFSVLDPGYYVKNILNVGITFVVPIPYIMLVALFILLYSYLLKQKISAILYPIIAMAVILPLFYLLADMKIGMRTANPYSWKRGIFGLYSEIYFFSLVSFFSLLTGAIFRNLLKAKALQDIIFHMPIFIYFVYIMAMLFLNNFRAYCLYGLLLFLAAVSLEKISVLLMKIKEGLARFTKNEKLFLMVIFIAAFLIRYFWGARLLGIVGDNFIIASDDGPCYDKFAALLANGNLLPKDEIYVMNGFGYWYFLGAIYNIFGAHNFKAVFAIQSFFGALVPVFTYFIAKKVFKESPAAVIAGIMTTVDMTLVFLTVVIGMESVYIPLAFLALALTAYLVDAKMLDYKRAFLLGIVLGLANLFRSPELLLLPPVIAAIIIYALVKKRVRAVRITGIITLFFIGFILLTSIQYVTNYLVYGTSPKLPPAAVKSYRSARFTPENKMLGDMGFNPFESLPRSFDVFRRNPATVLKLIATGSFKRGVVLYFLPNFGTFDAVYLVNPASGYFFRFPVYVQCYGCLLIITGMFAVFLKREGRIAAFIIFMCMLYLSSRGVLFSLLNTRNRGVLMPILFLFLAYGMVVFYTRVKEAYLQKK